MMSSADVNMTLYFRRKHTPPPSVLLLTAPNDKDHYYHINPSVEHHSHHKKVRQPPPQMIGLHVNNLDVHDTSTLSFGWQRHSDKITHMHPAPDVAYRYTYLDEIKREKSNVNNGHQSSSSSARSQPSPRLRLNSSFSHVPSESSKKTQRAQQYLTIYDHIRDSIRQMERQRSLKQQNISSRVKRPQNEDSTLQRVLSDRKTSTRSSMSRSSSTTTSSLFNNNLKSPQSFVNYINHSRALYPTPSDQ
jgi:hypothetical protein